MFKCIKNIRTIINNKEYITYKEGKIYRSDQDECITDERKNIDHRWFDTSFSIFPEHFKLYHRNKRGLKNFPSKIV